MPAYEITFPGGKNADVTSNFTTDNWYILQSSVGFPNNANKRLDGKYVFEIAGITIDNKSGTSSTALIKSNKSYSSGDQLTSTDQFSGSCSIRLKKTGGSQVNFGRSTSSSTPQVKLYTSSDTLNYTWGGQLSGSWTWYTVPTAPTNVLTTVNGLTVTVTYTDSTSDGGNTISGYTIEYSSSSDGATYGAWASFTNGSALTPGLYYKFRVYATNTVGDSEAGESQPILLSSLVRYTGSTWSAINGSSPSQLKRCSATSPSITWTNIATVKRFNGTEWDPIEF